MLEFVETFITMATTTHSASGISSAASVTETHVVHQTYALLRFLSGTVPIVAGANKFANLLAHWKICLTRSRSGSSPLSAGTTHARRRRDRDRRRHLRIRQTTPRSGCRHCIVVAIALQLLIGGHYLDVAVRDIVIALTGSLSLARFAPLASGDPV
ncbi:MAG: tRNA (5-methylaminomethyl-2-thiouridylate)-methyltransferase [Nibricoccus sp.]